MNLKRYLISNLRDVWVLVRQFRTSLFLFVVVVSVGALILKMLYVSPESGGRISYIEALYATFNMVFFEQTIYVDDVLLNVVEMEIRPGSLIAGKTVAELEKELELSVILYKGRDKVDLHPAPNIRLQGGDKIVIFASLDVLHQCCKLNQPAEL